MENKCSVDPRSQESCHVHPQLSGAHTSQPESCCPIQKATDMWTCAFKEAKRQVCVDILKTKIQKAWGANLEKTADVVISAMESEWKAKLASGKAKMDLKEQMSKIMANCEK